MTYEHLGGNDYLITIRAYRDCNPGNAAYNGTASIDVMDSTGALLQTLTAPLGTVIPLSISQPCFVTPPGVCIEYTEYQVIANLPPIAGGYSLTYGICCRNAIIVNIPNPRSASYQYDARIPSNDVGGNNSPQFQGSPPVLVCLGRPIDINLNVMDPDGDSLSYELCDIYDRHGNVIQFNSPYSSRNPLPASPAFGIDPVTGKLQGTATQIGHYVVGICVTEWRNNKPLSTVRLDYQFNVTSCFSIYSDMLTQAEDSSLFCSGLTINFTSQSQNASRFFWDFGDTTVTTDTSNQQNPTYRFPSPGRYTVMHIAEPGDSCSDTAYAVFDVGFLPTGGFVGGGDYCFSDQPIQLVPDSLNSDSLAYLWDFGPLAIPNQSTSKVPPPVMWAQGGEHVVKLTMGKGKCQIVFEDTISLADELVSDMISPMEDSSMLCSGLRVRFISEGLGADKVYWDFGDLSTLADTARTDTAYYTYPSQGFYKVRLIVEQEQGCRDTSSMVIEAIPAFSPQLTQSGRFCFESQNVNLEATGAYPGGTSFDWDLGPLASRPSMQGAKLNGLSWNQPGRHPIVLTVTKGTCVEEVYDTVDIPAWSVPVDAGPDTTIQSGQTLRLTGSPGNSYYWSSSDPVVIANPFGRTTDVQLSQTNDTLSFYYTVTDINGCQGTDTLKVVIIPRDGEDAYNVITPNGDGRNDFFDLSAFMLGRDCEFTVLNRWGSEVYSTVGYLNDWRGVDNAGRPLPDGTYYYILFCERQVTAKGPITIIDSDQK